MLPNPHHQHADEASITEEEAGQKLLGCAVPECDHRLDIEKHCRLLRKLDITRLFTVSKLANSVYREAHATSGAFSQPRHAGRDHDSVLGELTAFCGHAGPSTYTLAEIYGCFGFGDKLTAVKMRADQALFSTIRFPGAGLAARQPLEEQSSSVWTDRFPPPDLRAEAASESALREGREGWTPPIVARLQRFVRAGASLLATDTSGQTPLHVLCESAVLHAKVLAEKAAVAVLEDKTALEAIESAKVLHSEGENAVALLASATGKDSEGEEPEERSAAAGILVLTNCEGASAGTLCALDDTVVASREADAADMAFAELVVWCCREAPLSAVTEDSEGRTPLCILVAAVCVVDNCGRRAPAKSALVRSFRALCQGLVHCFAAVPMHVLHVARHSESFRDAAEAAAMFFDDMGGAPKPLQRLVDWIDVAMGGAWEMAQDEWRHNQRARLEDTFPGVEQLVDSAIRLNRIHEQIEQKTEEWQAEEASLKLWEFQSRCGQRARQYEDKIAKLEAEIEQRARSLQQREADATLSVLALEDAAPSVRDKRETSPTMTVSGGGSEALSESDNTQVGSVPGAAAGQLAPPPDAPASVEQAREVVRGIRQKRLVDCDLADATEEMQQGLNAMKRSLCAAVERLATDLYADQCHCLWELIQNADDNRYAEGVAVPSLEISLQVDDGFGAYIMTVNNEVGLSTTDVQAICDVNASLKGVGQTGHKGIGWKSVFRVSDCPHVLSHSFAFKFQVNGPLGKLAFVTPTALTDGELASLPESVKQAQSAGCTVMFLPLRCTQDLAAAEAELQQIAEQHLCLTFLRRLQSISLGFPNGTRTRMRRTQTHCALSFPPATTAAVQITETAKDGQELRHVVPEYIMYNHRVALPSGEVVGDLTLAFPLQAAGREEETAPLQQLFTFLPVRFIGFRFAIHGPFDLTADRGNLHGKSARNRALLTAVPQAFVEALRTVPDLRSRALSLFGQETPEATWLAIRGQMLDSLRGVECIPTEPDGQLAKPSECLLSPDDPRAAEAAQYLPPEVLWARCQQRVVCPTWAAKHRSQLQRLGVQELGLQQWLQVLQGAATGDSFAQAAASKGDTGFFRRVFALLGDAVADRPEVLEELQDVPLLPGRGGCLLRLADGPVYISFAEDVPQSWQRALEDVGAIRTLDPTVVAVLDALARRFLEAAGVAKPRQADIVSMAAEWHLRVSSRAAQATAVAAAARRSEAELAAERARVAAESLAAIANEASSTRTAGQGFSGALAERMAAAHSGHSDRELVVPEGAGPLGIRLSAGSGVVAEVESPSWAEQQGIQAGDEVVTLGGAATPALDRWQLRSMLGRRPLTLRLRPRRLAQHHKAALRLAWPEEAQEAKEEGALGKAAAAKATAKLEEARSRRPRGFWDAKAEAERRLAARSSGASPSADVPANASTSAVDTSAGSCGAPTESTLAIKDSAVACDSMMPSAKTALVPAVTTLAVPRSYPDVTLARTTCGLWASLACMRLLFFAGAAGVALPSRGVELSWEELGEEGLVVPTGHARRGFGPVGRLTSPTYLGEMAGGELTQDVIIMITRFVHGTEAATQDAGVFADPAPPLIGGTDVESEKQTPSSGSTRAAARAKDLLEWECFLDALGMRRLSPCSQRQQVAGTVLTGELGRRLSSAAWWRRAAEHPMGFAYLRSRLESADRVELYWLKSLRTTLRVDVSQLFLRGPFLRYGGSFLPYLDIHEPSPGMLACLERLGIATTVSGKSLRACLTVLEADGNCRDVGVYADIYAALQSLPQKEQEASMVTEFGRPLESFHIFLPPMGFRTAAECVWADEGRGGLCWLAGLASLQPSYGRFGTGCREWLMGPRCGVVRDLGSVSFEKFLTALRSLVEQAIKARRLPVERHGEWLDGPTSPTAANLLANLQQTAVQAYKYMARRCGDFVEREMRQHAHATIARAFATEALIIITKPGWPTPKRLRTDDVFWDTAQDLAGTKAEQLALKRCYPSEDHEVLRGFFVGVVGIPEMLSREVLESRLRVPLDEGPEERTAWQEGFDLGDFEEVRQIRQGPSVLGDDSGLFQELPDDEVALLELQGYVGSSTTGRPVPGAAAGAGSQPRAASEAVAQAEPERAAAAVREEGAETQPSVQRADNTAARAAPDGASAAENSQQRHDSMAMDGGARTPSANTRVHSDQSSTTLNEHTAENLGEAAEFPAPPGEPSGVLDEATGVPGDGGSMLCEAAGSHSANEQSTSSGAGHGGAASSTSGNATAPGSNYEVLADAAAWSVCGGSAAATRGSGRKRKMPRAEYVQLMKRLQEAENRVKVWTQEVQSVEQQLILAEERREYYQRVLRQRYEQEHQSRAAATT